MTKTFIAEYNLNICLMFLGIYSAVKYKDSNMYFFPRRGIDSRKS